VKLKRRRRRAEEQTIETIRAPKIHHRRRNGGTVARPYGQIPPDVYASGDQRRARRIAAARLCFLPHVILPGPAVTTIRLEFYIICCETSSMRGQNQSAFQERSLEAFDTHHVDCPGPAIGVTSYS